AMAVLRDVIEDDLPVFFEHQRDPEAVEMAAFPSREREPFFEHWHRIMDDDELVAKTIVSEGEVVGNIGSWEREGKRLVGYWLGGGGSGGGLCAQGRGGG